MKPRALVLVLAGLLASGTVVGLSAVQASRNATMADLRNLQGTWNLIETDVQGQSIKPRVLTQWIFEGNKLYLRSGGRTVPQGVIDIGSPQKNNLNLIVQGQRALLGIYEFRDRKLTICSAPDERPAFFVAEGNHVVNVLERAKAPRALHRRR